MSHHIVESRIAILGFLHTYDFHLVELVQTVESANVLSVRACLTTEARGVCRQPLRDFILLEDNVSEDISYRNLCGRHHIEIVQISVVHLPFLVRKLAGTET